MRGFTEYNAENALSDSKSKYFYVGKTVFEILLGR
jgi:hypothetical protein